MGEYRLYSRKLDPKTGKRRNLGTFGTRAAAEKHEKSGPSISSTRVSRQTGECIIRGMHRKYFGTDGIRGQVGEPPITPDLMMKLGWAAGRTLVSAESARRGDRPGVLIGKDTRISGYMIEAALEAGLSAAGVDVYLCGPMPTPGSPI